MNKGIKTLLGAVVGFFLLATIIDIIEDGSVGFDGLSIVLLMPGAIVGALVGSKIGENDNKKTVTDEDNNKKNTNQATEELLKFKQLLDIGAITQEEFDKKKKEYLDKL